MTIFNLPQNETALGLIGRSFGTGVGQGLNQRLSDMLKAKQNQMDTQNLIKSLNLAPEMSEKLAPLLSNPEFRSEFVKQYPKHLFQQEAAQSKRAAEEVKEKEAQKKETTEWEGVIKDLEKGVPYTGASIPFTKTMFAHFPWSKARENRELFDVTAFQLERYARAAHTKGTLSTKVYESLLSKLPDSKLSEAINRGRIKAWKNALLGNKNLPEKFENIEQKKKPPLESFIKR